MTTTNLPTDAECLFCKIVAGKIPCLKLYEDARVLAFLDIGPLSRGHCLVIPKGHWATLDQMPPEDAGACMAVAPKLARALIAVTGVRDFNVLQNNGRVAHQVVMHVHFHLIPKTGDTGLSIGWPAGKLDAEDGKKLAAQIAAALG